MHHSDITQLEAKTSTALGIEIYLSPPSLFVAQNLRHLLPELPTKKVWVLLLLQQSQVPLNQLNPQVEIEKNLLRNKFMNFSLSMAHTLRSYDFYSDFFDPITGYPVLSHPGTISHDDVAMVNALLGFSMTDDDCTGLIHPIWQTAVYPGVLMTTATPAVIESVVYQKQDALILS
jgi:hypothetical protein